ncbi:hypothetical protein WJX74_007947 [Apatococcus lobatus]|uniref:S-adenosyl-L-methionine-dependent methyltransferase n=1 Tax=Apatococcus lobatus TaxID=904363 RepID=A0AAW1QZW2_9CHLO
MSDQRSSCSEAERNTVFNGLDNAVSYSAQMVAAYRALESEQEDALFQDLLAESLAGPAAMEDARLQTPEWIKGEGSAGGQKRRRVQYSRMAVRTKFIDDCIAQSLTSQEGLKQVVLLGAGMDSRAWRMPMPEGVSWFEVDMADVLLAKQKALSLLGAEISAPAGLDACGQLAPAHASALGQQFSRYPLRPDKWISFEANLEGDTWQKELKAHGFRPEIPTVWVAEGLLMYLTPEAVDKLLAGTSDLSCPGSTLVTMAFNEETLGRDDLTVGDYARTQAWDILKSSFKAGFPDKPTQWLEHRGWRAHQVLTYGEIAHQVAGMDSQYSFDVKAPGIAGRRVFFITASPTSQ